MVRRQRARHLYALALSSIIAACARQRPSTVCCSTDGAHGPAPTATTTVPGLLNVAAFGAGGGRCPGGDDAVCIQAAINSLSHGGTVFLPAGEYVTRSTIQFANTSQWTATGIHPPASVILQGAGRESTIIRYAGTAPNTSVIAISSAYFALRDLSVHMAHDGFPARCIDIVDSVYFDITNVACWSRSGYLNNRLVGIAIRSTKHMVPPPGSGHLSNFIYYAADGSAKPGSRGILLDGSHGDQILFMTIDGWGDIENAEASIELNSVANTVIGGSYLLAGGDNGLRFTNASYNNVVGQTRIQYTTGGVCNKRTGIGCAVWIDKHSFDNVVEHIDLFQPNNDAILDEGIRTVWITTGDGTQPSVLPGHVKVGELWARTLTLGSGATVTGHLSGFTEWTSTPLAPHTSLSTSFSVEGAALGDSVVVGFGGKNPGGALMLTGQVSAPNVVTITMFNSGTTWCAPGSGTLRADVWKHQ